MEKPTIGVPEKKAGKGRPPSLLKTDVMPTKVCDIVKNLCTGDWKTYTVRDTAKGPLVLDVWVQEVYKWDGSAADCRRELLVVHRNRKEAGDEYKYSLSNGDLSKHTWLQLAKAQSQRNFIERSFQDAKQEAGMSKYQVRAGWHGIITLHWSCSVCSLC